jgi:hypothetical protein
MTLNQLYSLEENELMLLFHIVNVISPTTFPKLEYDMKSVAWIRQEHLVRKLVEAFPRVKPEVHTTYSSLLNKLGIRHEIKHQSLPAPVTSSISGSV